MNLVNTVKIIIFLGWINDYALAHPELFMQLFQMPFQNSYHNHMQFPMGQFQADNNFNPQYHHQQRQSQQEQLQQQQQQLQQQQQIYNNANQKNHVYENDLTHNNHENFVPYEQRSPLAHGVTQHRQQNIVNVQEQQGSINSQSRSFDRQQPLQQQLQQAEQQQRNFFQNDNGPVATGGDGIIPSPPYPHAYRPTQAHVDFDQIFTKALNYQNSPHDFRQQQNQQRPNEEQMESFGFAPGTPILFCGYGLPIPQYDTPHKKCIPWHPLCGITFTCIMDV